MQTRRMLTDAELDELRELTARFYGPGHSEPVTERELSRLQQLEHLRA